MLFERRTEQEGKLLQLEAEIAAANAVTPADVQRMEAEVQALYARIAEAEAVANAKGSQVRAWLLHISRAPLLSKTYCLHVRIGTYEKVRSTISSGATAQI